MAICNAVQGVVSFILLTGIVDLGVSAAAVKIVIPDRDKTYNLITTEEFYEEVLASDFNDITMVVEPDDSSFTGTLSYPKYVIKNATQLTAGTYNITVTATGVDGSTAERKLCVIVTDGTTETNQHDPVFIASPEQINVVEDADTGTSLVKVTATDADIASPDNRITFSIGGTDFAINNVSGVVTLETSLNFSSKPIYELIIIATDGGTPPRSASRSIIVSVQTRPVWSFPAPGETEARALAETATTYKILTLEAIDEDQNGTLVYNITDQEPFISPMFEIINSSVYTMPQVDFDVDADDAPSFYTLTFSVFDGEYYATQAVKLQVNITDENDNRPVFDHQSYEENIPEYRAPGSFVIRVSASDDDLTQPNNIVTHRLSDTSVFEINNETGIISVATPTQLEYTTKQIHELFVIATDGGSPANTGYAMVKITLLTAPVWPEHGIVAEVLETDQPGSTIYHLNATDADSSATLSYTLLSPSTLFLIEGDLLKTGPNASFDIDDANAQTAFNLSIRVEDDLFAADTFLIVSVTDVNEHVPVFSEKQYTKEIDETHTLDSLVLQVEARDADRENIISYSLLNKTDIFDLDESDGRLLLRNPPDQIGYTLKIQATDSGIPPKSTDIIVTIVINSNVVGECVTVSCSNGGSGQSSVNKYVCTCVSGWSGTLCDINIDDCAESPCLNGGSCLDGVNMYTCDCTEGWSGDTCSEVCSANTFGKNCAYSCKCDLNKTQTSALEENQICDIKTGACKCNSEWKGYSCEEDTNECDNQTICAEFDNMACGNFIGGYICGCVKGYRENESNINLCEIDTETTDVSPRDNEIKMDVKITLNATRIRNLHITSEYKKISQEVRKKVEELFPLSTRVVIQELRSGSLRVKMLLFIPNQIQAKVVTTVKLQKIREGLAFTLFDEKVSTEYLEVSEKPLPVNGFADKGQLCEIYNAAFECPSGEECRIDNETPVCEQIAKDNSKLILGLGLGILLPAISLVALVAVVTFWRLKRSRKAKMIMGRTRAGA